MISENEILVEGKKLIDNNSQKTSLFKKISKFLLGNKYCLNFFVFILLIIYLFYLKLRSPYSFGFVLLCAFLIAFDFIDVLFLFRNYVYSKKFEFIKYKEEVSLVLVGASLLINSLFVGYLGLFFSPSVYQAINIFPFIILLSLVIFIPCWIVYFYKFFLKEEISIGDSIFVKIRNIFWRAISFILIIIISAIFIYLIYSYVNCGTFCWNYQMLAEKAIKTQNPKVCESFKANPFLPFMYSESKIRFKMGLFVYDHYHYGVGPFGNSFEDMFLNEKQNDKRFRLKGIQNCYNFLLEEEKKYWDCYSRIGSVSIIDKEGNPRKWVEESDCRQSIYSKCNDFPSDMINECLNAHNLQDQDLINQSVDDPDIWTRSFSLPRSEKLPGIVFGHPSFLGSVSKSSGFGFNMNIPENISNDWGGFIEFCPKDTFMDQGLRMEFFKRINTEISLEEYVNKNVLGNSQSSLIWGPLKTFKTEDGVYQIVRLRKKSDSDYDSDVSWYFVELLDNNILAVSMSGDKKLVFDDDINGYSTRDKIIKTFNIFEGTR